MIEIPYSSKPEFITAVHQAIMECKIVQVYTDMTPSHLGERLRENKVNASVFRDPVLPCVYIRQRGIKAYIRPRKEK